MLQNGSSERIKVKVVDANETAILKNRFYNNLKETNDKQWPLKLYYLQFLQLQQSIENALLLISSFFVLIAAYNPSLNQTLPTFRLADLGLPCFAETVRARTNVYCRIVQGEQEASAAICGRVAAFLKEQHPSHNEERPKSI